MNGLMFAGLAIFLAIIGVPLFAVLGGLAILLWTVAEGWEMGIAVVAEMVRLSSAPALGAIPLFTFAGFVLANSGAPKRLVDLARSVLSWIPGGLACVALASCAFFTAFTGASGVTIIALGGLLYPILIKEKYPEKFTLGLLTTTGSLGLLFPPSLPLILYGIVSKVEIKRLFLAGIVPGILLITVLAIYAGRVGRQSGVKKEPFSGKRIWKNAKIAAWEIPLPILVLVGIYGGYITATEAAAVTAAYVTVVIIFIKKELSLSKDLPRVIKESMSLVGGILVILGTAMGLTNFLIDAEVPMQIFEAIQRFIHSKFTFLLALNILLILVGCLMDIFSALVVVVPLIIPVAAQYGVDPLHLGIIFLTNLEIGYSTPPVGLNLFLSSYRFNKPVIQIYKASLPFLFLLLACLMVITYVPELSLWLPNMFGG